MTTKNFKQNVEPPEEGQFDVPAPVEVQSIVPATDFFTDLDSASEHVIQKLSQRVTDAWVYQFTMQGKQVRGLSAAGAMEAATALAHLSKGQFVIRVLGLESLENTEDSIDATVKAGVYVIGVVDGKPNEVLLNTSIGFHSQPKVGQRRDGSTWDINHPKTLAVVKAQRNAIGKLLPDAMKKRIIEVALAGGKIQDESDETPPNPPRRGNRKATDAELNQIADLLLSDKISQKIKDNCDKAVARGLTSAQVSAWISTLKSYEKGKQGELV